MSDGNEQAASDADTKEPEHTFDIYLLATVKVRGKDLDAARHNLRTELVSIDLPDYADSVTDNIRISSIEFLGAAQAFVADSAQDESAADAFYDGSGFERLERLAMSSDRLPLMFRVVQLSPEGDDMRPMTPDKLDEFMDFDQVIRVGLAGEVCTVDGIYAPLVGVDDDGTVHIDHEGWEVWQPVTPAGRGGTQVGPIISSTVLLGEELAEQILRRPGLYVQVWTNLPDRSWLILRTDDSEQVWEAQG
ncbi:hypothetical protein OG563_26640 [Nocardia vinacea]|uniref:Uncharacterized protein n=1 Tax=Nocardia vinacea TaxID=96468 RepID=A0ABZ1YHZ9_9NOCA|nr:hypothetical protein [Nocardia vinacea]